MCFGTGEQTQGINLCTSVAQVGMEEYFRSHTCNEVCIKLGLDKVSAETDELTKLRRRIMAEESQIGGGPVDPEAMSIDELLAAFETLKITPTTEKPKAHLEQELHAARNTNAIPTDKREVADLYESFIQRQKLLFEEKEAAAAAKKAATAVASSSSSTAAAAEVATSENGSEESGSSGPRGRGWGRGRGRGETGRGRGRNGGRGVDLDQASTSSNDDAHSPPVRGRGQRGMGGRAGRGPPSEDDPGRGRAGRGGGRTGGKQSAADTSKTWTELKIPVIKDPQAPPPGPQQPPTAPTRQVFPPKVPDNPPAEDAPVHADPCQPPPSVAISSRDVPQPGASPGEVNPATSELPSCVWRPHRLAGPKTVPKMPICKYYNWGHCNKGTSCEFRHVYFNGQVRGNHQAAVHDQL